MKLTIILASSISAKAFTTTHVQLLEKRGTIDSLKELIQVKEFAKVTDYHQQAMLFLLMDQRHFQGIKWPTQPEVLQA
jgi:hypothetical protein